jgi:hypothetical protein
MRASATANRAQLKGLSMTDLSAFRSAIAFEIDGAIYFRTNVAERFPEDERNVRCVEALTHVQEKLNQLGDDDLQLARCFKAYREKHSAAGNLDCFLLEGLWFPKSDSELPSIGYPSKQVFSRYGFNAPEDGDPGSFLKSLLDEIESWEPDDLALENV